MIHLTIITYVYLYKGHQFLLLLLYIFDIYIYQKNIYMCGCLFLCVPLFFVIVIYTAGGLHFSLEQQSIYLSIFF